MANKNYAIMRIAKLTTNNDFARVLNHNNRNYENTPGVDKEKSHLNVVNGIEDYQVLKNILQGLNKSIEGRTGKKVAKNRVRGFEVLFAVNREFLAEGNNASEYFSKAEEWTRETFGDGNFVGSNIHLDEDGAPHMHVTVLCRDLESDSQNYMANKWVSNRESLTKLQDVWHSKVAHMGLERGQSAKYTHDYHKTKSEYVKLLEKDIKAVAELPEYERNLLAAKGLRMQQQEEKMINTIREHQKDISKDTVKTVETVEPKIKDDDFEL